MAPEELEEMLFCYVCRKDYREVFKRMNEKKYLLKVMIW